MSNSAGHDRLTVWAPPARPDWVRRINEEGSYMDIKSVVPLDENSLLGAARANTGLSDFGDDNWYEPFKVLIAGLDQEAELNLMGRIITRSDLLIFLEARLRIEDTYKKNPEIDDQEIKSPIFITGQGRTGTSELHKLLALDPDNAVMLNWEVMFPCPPPEAATYATDPRIEKAHNLQDQVYRVTPEYRAIHEYGGATPCENVHMQCLSFRSPAYMFSHAGQALSYFRYMLGQDPVLAYQYEKRTLKLLQWKNPRKRWVFKSPYALIELPSILQVYPDVKFVMTHRDPIKSLASVVNLLGTLSWMRSDHVFIGGSNHFTDPTRSSQLLNQVVDWLEDGTIPKAQFCNILFKDFIADPLSCAETIYSRFDVAMTAETRGIVETYISDKFRARQSHHKYDVGSSDLITEERRVFKRYQDYFSVPSEM